MSLWQVVKLLDVFIIVVFGLFFPTPGEVYLVPGTVVLLVVNWTTY